MTPRNSVIKAIDNFGFLAQNSAMPNTDSTDEKQENKSDTSAGVKSRQLHNMTNCTDEDKRVLAALVWNDDVFHFNLEKLDHGSLKIIATQTNHAKIQYSGNCTGLASCVLYNLKIGRTDLAMQNTSPFYRSTGNAEPLILGNYTSLDFPPTGTPDNVSALSETILDRFKNTGERAYLISAVAKNSWFSVLLNHSFNAVVVSQTSQPEVIYVDSWAKKIYTTSELDKEYKAGKYELTLWYVKDKLIPLEKPEKVRNNSLINTPRVS